MRSLVISAFSRTRATSSRSVFMLTGITSCTMGSTKAPPSRTTRWPPRPVRTKARSLLLRRYSQCSSHTPMATTIAAITRPRRKVPNWAPVMGGLLLLSGDLDEAARGFRERQFGGQALHGARAVEAVAAGALRQDPLRVL